MKGKAYVELKYMAGILPIAKYSSGSELNMFFEYTIATRKGYSDYFGFTDSEVDELYQRYLDALSDNQLGSYWTSSGSYDEIFYYINHNVDEARDDLVLIISGIPVRANIQEYAAVLRLTLSISLLQIFMENAGLRETYFK